MNGDFKKNDRLSLKIDNLGVNGEGVGRLGGFVFFVPGALPGEIVEILAVSVKKDYGYGKLLCVVEPSPSRVESVCPYYGRCGGCALLHYEYSAQLLHKAAFVKNCLIRIGGFHEPEVSPAIGMDEPYHYRNKAQYPVGLSDGKPVTGFYSRRSHRIIEIDECVIQDARNPEILSVIKKYIRDYNIIPYDENTGLGLLRHILIKSARNGDALVCLVVNARSIPGRRALVEALQAVPGVKSIQLNINTKKTNVILSGESELLWGEPHIIESVSGIEFRISALSFFQTNLSQTEKMHETILRFAGLRGGETVIDAFCGIGAITLLAARYAGRVIGIEIVPQAISDARINAAQNDIKNAEFILGDANQEIPRLTEGGVLPELIILDPPRKGCGRELLQAIIKAAPRKVIYVSCNPATLARDLSVLRENGFMLSSAVPIDMFPHTAHVESVVLMQHERD